jgi:hypothetical protein
MSQQLLKALNPEITAEEEAKGTNLLLCRTFYCDSVNFCDSNSILIRLLLLLHYFSVLFSLLGKKTLIQKDNPRKFVAKVNPMTSRLLQRREV